jgi:hypothetical protein
MTTADEFYVGYEGTVPPGIARLVRSAVAIAALAAIAAAILFVSVERPLARSSFAFGEEREWTGYLVRRPAPALLVPRGGSYQRHWLVARGKHGAEVALRGLADGWVSVTGSAIEREPWHMIEIAAARHSPAPARATLPAPSESPSRRVTLVGEVVDSKCFLGVMNPGERIVHRDCATRCLLGGITPMFLYAAPSSARELAVLVVSDGRPVADVIGLETGHAITLSGSLSTIDEVPVLSLDSRLGASRP